MQRFWIFPLVLAAFAVGPGGFALDPDRVEDIAICDSLVVRGSLATIDGLEEGHGYRLSDELAAAFGQRAANN